MSEEKRKREEKLEFPDSQLWHIPEFVEKVRKMLAVEPPKVPEKVISDLGDDDDPDPIARAPMSMSIDPESGDGCATPPSGGASYGGPSYPIDVEEAEAAKRLRMKEMALKEERADEELAAIRARRALSSVPAAVGGGATARQVCGPAADSGESSKECFFWFTSGHVLQQAGVER